MKCNCLLEGCLRGCEPVRGCTCEGRQNPLRHTTQPVPLLICRLIGRETVDLASGWPSAFYYVWARLQQTIHMKTRLLPDRIPGRAHPTADVDGLIVASCWICSAPATHFSEKSLGFKRETGTTLHCGDHTGPLADNVTCNIPCKTS